MFKNKTLNILNLIFIFIWFIISIYSDLKLFDVVDSDVINAIHFIVYISFKCLVPWNFSTVEITDFVWGGFVFVDAFASILIICGTSFTINNIINRYIDMNKNLSAFISFVIPIILNSIIVLFVFSPSLAL